jgi:hypothetical protein
MVWRIKFNGRQGFVKRYILDISCVTLQRRTDGVSPSWQEIYQYSRPALPSGSSGFRGLTCVPNLHGAGVIGFHQAGVNSGNVTLKASGSATSGPFFNGSYGSFHITDALGLDTGARPSMPDFGSSATVATKGAPAAATIWIYVEEAGLTGPSPPFQVGLTANFLSAGWTAVETAYESLGGGAPPPWVTTNALFSHMFTGTNVAVAVNGIGAGAASNPYTLTELLRDHRAGVVHVGSCAPDGERAHNSGAGDLGDLAMGFIGLGYGAFRGSVRSRVAADVI